MEPRSDHLLSTNVLFVRFDPADWTVPGNNLRVSNAVFQRSPIIIVVGSNVKKIKFKKVAGLPLVYKTRFY